MIGKTSKRVKRWVAKTEPELFEVAYRASRSIQVQLGSQAQREHDMVIAKIKPLLDERVQNPYLKMCYVSYAATIYYLRKNLGRQLASREAAGQILKWEFRGLERDLMLEIAKLFDLDPEPTLSELAMPADITESLKQALRETVGEEAGETVNICREADISKGVSAPLKNYERWTLYLKTAGAITIYIYLSPDGGVNWYQPEESPVIFNAAGDKLIEFGYDATNIKLVGSNSNKVTAQVRGVF